jgi:hypothetical protein
MMFIAPSAGVHNEVFSNIDLNILTRVHFMEG